MLMTKASYSFMHNSILWKRYGIMHYIFFTKKECIEFIIEELNEEIKKAQSKINELKSCII